MKKITQDDYIKKANCIHNNFYIYDKTVYTNMNNKIIITCPYHGDFEQRPDQHVAGNGCKLCGCARTSKKVQVTKEKFLVRAEEIHGNKYDYSEVSFKKMKDKIKIICPVHGLFIQSVDAHLNVKCGCRKCADITTANNSRKTTELFITESNIIHNNSYDYSMTKYKSNKDHVIIICPVHGEFIQLPYNHLHGKGCDTCKREGIFTKSGFIKTAKNKECTFYILRCYSNDENFYKVGITSNNIKRRYQSKSLMPYQYDIIKETKGTAEEVWDLEHYYKNILRCYKYIPKIQFNGHITECFISIDYELSVA